MSLGGTLGQVFGGIGQGLSFLGPIGMGVGAALSAAGGIAATIGDKKEEEKRLKEQEEAQQAAQQAASGNANPMQQNNGERPQQAQIDNTQPTTPQPPQRNTFTPVGNQGMQGGYQNQLQESIIPSIILGGNDPFGGP